MKEGARRLRNISDKAEGRVVTATIHLQYSITWKFHA